MFSETVAIFEKELRTTVHNPTERIVRLIRPMLWLLLFGSVIKLVSIAPGINYQQFMLPGILINAIVVTAMSHGMTLKWEFDLGILNRMLAAPVARTAIVLGKALSCVVKGLIEGTIFLILAWVIQIKFYPEVLTVLLSAGILTIFVIGVASFGMMLAIVLKSREAYVGIVGLVATPSLFASNSLYNLNQMPRWLQILAEVNPVTYAVDFIRRLLIYQAFDSLPLLLDTAVLAFFSLIMLMLAALVFSRSSR